MGLPIADILKWALKQQLFWKYNGDVIKALFKLTAQTKHLNCQRKGTFVQRAGLSQQ